MNALDYMTTASRVWIAAVSALAVFVVDLLLPLGIAVPIAYVGLILLGLWVSQRWYTLAAAAATSLLTVVGALLSPPGGPIWTGTINRAIVIGVLWSTATVVMLYAHARAEIKTLRGMLAICASCKRVRGDEGFWKHMEEYIEDHSEVLLSHCLCPSCQTKWFPELAARQSPATPSAVTESRS
jgi:hypothetical protein